MRYEVFMVDAHGNRLHASPYPTIAAALRVSASGIAQRRLRGDRGVVIRQMSGDRRIVRVRHPELFAQPVGTGDFAPRFNR